MLMKFVLLYKILTSPRSFKDFSVCFAQKNIDRRDEILSLKN